MQFPVIFYYLEFMCGGAPSPLSGGMCHTLAVMGSLPLSKHTGGGGTTPTISCQLVYLQFEWGVPFPYCLELRAPHPLCYVSFFFFAACLLFSLFFSLFSLSGGQSVQRAMLIWPRVVCGSTTCHLAHLVVCFSQAG
jgi:hypothetical protein